MKNLLLLICLISAGCETAPLEQFYEPYHGSQQNWPVAPGGFTTQVRGMTVYHGLPDVPYSVIGRLSRANIPLGRLVDAAQYYGANAVLLSEQQINGLQTDPGVTLFGNGFAIQTPGNTKTVTRTITYAYLIHTGTNSDTNHATH